MIRKKNIAVVSSTRADYHYLRLILKEIMKSKSLNLSLLITGTHLLETYGKTIDEIKNDQIPITEIVEMYIENNNSEINLGKAIGRGLSTFTEVLNKINPDLLLVLGDRYEALAAVIAASTLLIPIAHIHGGDNNYQGQVDEQIRHAITKFAHIHFPATKKSAERIKLLGEEEWRINMVGSPSIDHFYTVNFQDKRDICKNLGLNSDEDIIICIQHPYTINPAKAGEEMKTTLSVLRDLDLQCVIIYPNNDPGSHLIINEIKKNEGYPKFKVFKNLATNNYYSLLKNSSLLIGNSSGGLIESPIFKLPVINIGDRNKGRESANNVINVRPEYNEIKKAIKKALSKEFKEYCQSVKNPYGVGNASTRIVKILEDLTISKELLIKKLTYSV